MAAIPTNLVESELFGHTAGSFTGAVSSRIGRFEAAHHGTIFIDEIGDFELTAQATLLRVLESRCVTPVGSNEERNVDARVVAATSRRLPELVAERQFREDLYYRLNVVSIELPPLRERRDDIGLLIEHFLAESCQANQRPRPTIDLPLGEFLCRFDWPGNVRQLRNAIESMVVMSKGEILTLQDLPAHLLQAGVGSDPATAMSGTLDAMERMAMLQALERAGGNRTHAAEALGISVRTLQRRLKEWNLEPRDGELRH